MMSGITRKRSFYILLVVLILFTVIFIFMSFSGMRVESYGESSERSLERELEAALEEEHASQQAEETASAEEHHAASEEMVAVAAAPERATVGSAEREASRDNTLDEYTVVLGSDEHMRMPGLPGELRVWIGSQEYQADFPERMVQDETTVPAEGESAKVEPFAPAFEIVPESTQCIRVHPTGSEVRFQLFPKERGTFAVGANVYLFESRDCSGSPIPKTTSTLTVTVEVDTKGAVTEKMKELWDILWEKFLQFWAALVAIIFGLFLFLIRGRLKKWFGFEE